MSRPAALCAALAALAVGLAAGCSLIEPCGPFDFDEAERTDHLAASVVADTVTIAFVRPSPDTDLEFVGSDPRAYEVVYGAPTDSVRLAVNLKLGDYAEPLRIRARGDARTDTVFVRVARETTLFQRVCSPAFPYVQVRHLRVEVPAGVRHVRFAIVQEGPHAMRPARGPTGERVRVVRA